jgi:glycosyltransferase 2 family protein
VSRKPIWIAVQALFVGAVLWFAGRALAGQWSGLRALLAAAHPAWGMVLLSYVPVALAYAVLIQVWRGMLTAWGEGGRLSTWQATRIWFVSNLGRYLPGKIWQIATMGVMAQRRGVSPVAAAGSSLVVNLANVASGFVVVLATGATVFRSFATAGSRAGVLVAAILGAGLLLVPVAFQRAAPLVDRLSRQRVVLPRLPARAVWLAAVGTAVAWVLYGVAFELFCAALVHRTAGATSFYIASYTSSYLVGYLALFAPGGLVVREAMLVASLTNLGLLSAPEAWLVALASRLWLTVLEAMPGLLFMLAPGERS